MSQDTASEQSEEQTEQIQLPANYDHYAQIHGLDDEDISSSSVDGVDGFDNSSDGVQQSSNLFLYVLLTLFSSSSSVVSITTSSLHSSVS